MLLEVCVASLRDALSAAEAGADRLELNSALELGGLTPSPGLVREVLQATDLPVIAMVRPRGAGFCYDALERRVMLADAETLLEQGVAGIAFGGLTPERQIDQRLCRELVRLAGNLETVFHRAFDLVEDAQSAAQCLVDLNITRLLTSGKAATAIEGAHLIADIRRWTEGKLQLLPGAGVTASNVERLLHQSGCSQVHGSFSRPARDDGGSVASSMYRVTDRPQVAAVRRVLDGL
jgi:copper homeostasis protein